MTSPFFQESGLVTREQKGLEGKTLLSWKWANRQKEMQESLGQQKNKQEGARVTLWWGPSLGIGEPGKMSLAISTIYVFYIRWSLDKTQKLPQTFHLARSSINYTLVITVLPALTFLSQHPAIFGVFLKVSDPRFMWLGDISAFFLLFLGGGRAISHFWVLWVSEKSSEMQHGCSLKKKTPIKIEDKQKTPTSFSWDFWAPARNFWMFVIAGMEISPSLWFSGRAKRICYL